MKLTTSLVLVALLLAVPTHAAPKTASGSNATTKPLPDPQEATLQKMSPAQLRAELRSVRRTYKSVAALNANLQVRLNQLQITMKIQQAEIDRLKAQNAKLAQSHR